MGFRSNPRFIILVVAAAVFLLPLSLSRIAAAQENEGDESRSFQDLGRRGMVVVRNGGDAKSAGNDLKLESGLGIFDAFFASLSMILVSEIGDETFIIAALMAMRHPKSTVLSGALTALIVMTVLSTGLGRIVPNLISRKHTNSAATGTYYSSFTIAAISLKSKWEIVELDGARMPSRHSMKKCVINILLNMKTNNCILSTCSSLCIFWPAATLHCLEIGFKIITEKRNGRSISLVEEKLEAGQGKTSFRRYFSRFCTPIFLESFILTFLAEWGDRSQIATIADTLVMPMVECPKFKTTVKLATHKNAIGVAVGATLGHTICTSLAVVGGSILASKISQGTVATIGGLLFLCFSLSSYFYPPL
ncbi:hypothetical protein POTOM_058195 [Populus tomentosa]|uniref:GDT1 family protein n=1 Tax=Populus tomentosa TaxID=118781 RepID=A0A8X8C2N8_POPTO|nr:hypothetical protein POTOM_058195 [Populus tomentosa]